MAKKYKCKSGDCQITCPPPGCMCLVIFEPKDPSGPRGSFAAGGKCYCSCFGPGPGLGNLARTLRTRARGISLRSRIDVTVNAERLSLVADALSRLLPGRIAVPAHLAEQRVARTIKGQTLQGVVKALGLLLVKKAADSSRLRKRAN